MKEQAKIQENAPEKEQARKQLVKNIVLASLGLFLFGFGVYLTIRAAIGVGPWDAFNLGLSGTLGIRYGTASIAVSLIILVIDICLKEKIGIGMFLDSFIVGKTVDLFDFLHLVPDELTFAGSLVIIFAGMIVMGFSQYLYMKAGLGCGPRDSLLVGLSRRLPRIPIGMISIVILVTVTLVGRILGGPIGLGTVLCAGLEGMIMQAAFRILHFVPTDVTHQSLADSFRILSGRTPH